MCIRVARGRTISKGCVVSPFRAGGHVDENFAIAPSSIDPLVRKAPISKNGRLIFSENKKYSQVCNIWRQKTGGSV